MTRRGKPTEVKVSDNNINSEEERGRMHKTNGAQNSNAPTRQLDVRGNAANLEGAMSAI